METFVGLLAPRDKKMKEICIGNKKISTVCIVGAGNEGHYFMALMGSKSWLKVYVLTSNANGFSDVIKSTNTTTGEVAFGRVCRVSERPEDVIPEADVIIFTTPSNAYQHYANVIYPYVKEGTVLGFIPGTGGPEFIFRDFISQKKCRIFGTQRVPSGTKLVKRGCSVDSLGSRKDIRIGAIPRSITKDVGAFIHEAIDIDVVELDNYLSVALTPSNPILHTTRLYSLLKDYKRGDGWKEKLHMYSDWNDLSSEMLLGCDNELHLCCDRLCQLPTEGVLPLREHYEIDAVAGSTDVEKMTKKIRTLPYLKDFVPMVADGRGLYVPDFTTRYFMEDFPFGLCIIKSFCDICQVRTPHIDQVLSWYERIMAVSYFRDGLFVGKDLEKLPLPANFGLDNISKIINFYSR